MNFFLKTPLLALALVFSTVISACDAPAGDKILPKKTTSNKPTTKQTDEEVNEGAIEAKNNPTVILSMFTRKKSELFNYAE